MQFITHWREAFAISDRNYKRFLRAVIESNSTPDPRDYGAKLRFKVTADTTDMGAEDAAAELSKMGSLR